jgi:hypothetical protein
MPNNQHQQIAVLTALLAHVTVSVWGQPVSSAASAVATVVLARIWLEQEGRNP